MNTRLTPSIGIAALAMLVALLACGLPTVQGTATPCDEATLRSAIDAASPGATVDYTTSSACTVHLTSPLNIRKSVTLRAPGAPVTLDGGGSVQVFSVSASSPITFNLEGFTIAHGFSSHAGGGIENHGQTVKVTNTTFMNNTVTSGATSGTAGGGAIANDSGGKLTIKGSVFMKNKAIGAGALLTHGGGAIYVDNSALIISDSHFTDNSADGDNAVGGAIYVSGGATTVDRSQFTGNVAQRSGGAAALYIPDVLQITSDQFDSNGAEEGDGGGLWLEASGSSALQATVTGATWMHNKAPHGRGGGIFVDEYNITPDFATLTIDKSTFMSNIAASGGGVAVQDGPVGIQNSVLANNEAIGDAAHPLAVAPQIGGGGISVDFRADWGFLAIINSTIWGNKADALAGGGIAAASSVVILVYTTIAGNSAPEGGGLAAYNGSLNGSPLPSKVSAAASIVAENASSIPQAVNCHLDPGTIGTERYNLESGVDCSFVHPGSLQNADPLLDPAGLQNNGGPTQTVALLSGSPAIDVFPRTSNLCMFYPPTPGAFMNSPCPPQDQRGSARPDEPAEKACDIGAFETKY
jgi:hypothetical protein